MNIETPKNEPEEIKSIEEAESIVEMSPEDFTEMIDQLPALKEMLQERETRLSIFLGLSESESFLNESVKKIEALKIEIEKFRQELRELGEESNASDQKIEALRVEIEELRQEISEREELLGE